MPFSFLRNWIHRRPAPTEQALRESEARYRMIAETAQDQIFVINRDDTVEYVNRSGAEQLRTVPELLIGRRRQDIFPPEVADPSTANQPERLARSGRRVTT